MHAPGNTIVIIIFAVSGLQLAVSLSAEIRHV